MSGAIAYDEHLDRKHAHIAECFGNPAGDPQRLGGHRRRHFGGYSRYFQDMAAFVVFRGNEEIGFSPAPPGRPPGELPFGLHEPPRAPRVGADRSPLTGPRLPPMHPRPAPAPLA